MLEDRGYEVATAANAIDAGVEISGDLPSLIIMDIKMPGIDGLQACEAIKKNPKTKDVPIIIISALSSGWDINKAKKNCIADYFVKPIDIEKLVNRIRTLLP